MHADGNIPGTTLAQVEIECSDCHGAPNQYPWDLPLGFGEEFQTDIDKKARGTTTKVPVLLNIHNDKSFKTKDGQVAMWDISQHMESMECYTCHADWVPQCYGCHVTVDYSAGKDGKPKSDVDWIDNANSREANGMTADGALGTNGIKSPGKVSETRSYLRWETPILGVNGEGRVSPLMPGCQVITTIIGKDGSVLAKNEIWHTPEGKGIDHAAAQPHTAGRMARKCESCHDNPKTLGYGIEDGRFMQGYEKDLIVDLTDAMGNVIPGKATVQSPAIPKLDHDLSQIVTRDGKQLVSVGSHWPLTGPLPQDMREKMERTGVCMGCHQKQSDENFWKKVSEKSWLSNDAHQDLMKKALEAYSDNKK
jgi:cytochrome c553